MKTCRAVGMSYVVSPSGSRCRVVREIGEFSHITPQLAPRLHSSITETAKYVVVTMTSTGPVSRPNHILITGISFV